MKKPYAIIIMDGYGINPSANGNAIVADGSKYVTLAGITSLYVAEELTPDWGGDVVWLEGYDRECVSQLSGQKFAMEFIFNAEKGNSHE